MGLLIPCDKREGYLGKVHPVFRGDALLESLQSWLNQAELRQQVSRPEGWQTLEQRHRMFQAAWQGLLDLG